MTVKIVTDTLADISFDLAKQLGVTVVPLYVRFGEEIYKDRVEITAEDFYRRLLNEPKLPSTTQPSPAEFLEVYNKLSAETDEILTVTLSSKMSGTYQSASQAREMYKGKAKIEVIDSMQVALAEGLCVIAGVNAVKKGANLAKAAEVIRKATTRVHVLAYFDTLKYLAKGGRIGKASGLIGSLLSVKPILCIRDGEMAPLTRVRSITAGMDYLYNAYESYKDNIEGIAIEHTTTKVEADKLVERIGKTYPKEKIYREIISPVIGTYTGPGTVAMMVLEAEK
jgi:DegV family protein with EDD domain